MNNFEYDHNLLESSKEELKEAIKVQKERENDYLMSSQIQGWQEESDLEEINHQKYLN